MRRKISLAVLGQRQEDDLSPAELRYFLNDDGVAGYYVRRPKTRSDCAPDPLTVACPIDACGADAGEACFQFDPQTDTPKADRTYPPLLDAAGNRVQFPLVDARGNKILSGHFARIEAARAHLRPCPWVSCKFHLYLDVTATDGSITQNSRVPPDEMAHTCTLDLAEYGGMTLEDIGEVYHLTRERVRQVETRALLDVKAAVQAATDLDERKLDAERVARRTRFDARPTAGPARVGTCPACLQPRRRVRDEWRCACRKEWGKRAEAEPLPVTGRRRYRPRPA